MTIKLKTRSGQDFKCIKCGSSDFIVIKTLKIPLIYTCVNCKQTYKNK